MTTKLLFSSPLLVCTAASALLAVSQGGWTADHRDAPLISFLDTGQTVQCEDVLGLPMRVSVNVPAEVLRRANINVDLYTRSDTGLVDAADYIVWRKRRGTTLAVIVNPGDKPGYSQVNEGFITFPSMHKQAYAVRFRFESITDGKSCDLSTRIDYGLPNAVVVNWSSGAVRHAQ